MSHNGHSALSGPALADRSVGLPCDTGRMTTHVSALGAFNERILEA
jgi:hypothetical protein